MPKVTNPSVPVHKPIRRCAYCRRTAPKTQLLRFVRDPRTGQVKWDPSQRLAGRGGYLCPTRQCLQGAIKKRSLERALKVPVPRELLETVLATLEAQNICP